MTTPAIPVNSSESRIAVKRTPLRQRWILTQTDFIASEKLAKAARLPQVLAELLVARGITDADQANTFLNPDASHLNDPFLMLGMTAAVDRLQQ